MNKLKKIGMWFWTKNRIIQELEEINGILDNKVFEVVQQIEELRQDKIYVITAPGYTKEGLNQLRSLLEKAKRNMKWTLPPVLIVNADMRELKQSEIDMIIKHNKRKK